MQKQAINQAFENAGMEVVLEALGKSIARWTDKGDQLVTAIPGLSLFRRDEPTQPTRIHKRHRDRGRRACPARPIWNQCGGMGPFGKSSPQDGSCRLQQMYRVPDL